MVDSLVDLRLLRQLEDDVLFLLWVMPFEFIVIIESHVSVLKDQYLDKPTIWWCHLPFLIPFAIE